MCAVVFGQVGNGQRLDFQSAVHVVSAQGYALRTQACREGRIFMIGPRQDAAIAQAEGGTHMKVRVGRVGLFGGCFGSMNQFLNGRIQAAYFSLGKGKIELRQEGSVFVNKAIILSEMIPSS